MRIRVVKNGYFVDLNKLEEYVMVDENELKSVLYHSLVVGDLWELVEDEFEDYFKCIEGKFLGEINESWGYEGNEDYFEIIED